jgi:hypothetical protein
MAPSSEIFIDDILKKSLIFKEKRLDLIGRSTMSKAKFTSEQQQLLRNNPYTVRVTEDVLYLSKEFKELFYKEYLTGAIPRDILKKYGYPSAVLGKQRIWGISHTIRQQYEKPENFVMSAPRIHP